MLRAHDLTHDGTRRDKHNIKHSSQAPVRTSQESTQSGLWTCGGEFTRFRVIGFRASGYQYTHKIGYP